MLAALDAAGGLLGLHPETPASASASGAGHEAGQSEHGSDDGRAECASTPMPLSWDEPDGPTIDVYAKRLRAAGSATVQLWLP